MKNIQPKILSLLICTALYSPLVYSKIPSYCPQYEPIIRSSYEDFRTQPVDITADNLIADYPFKGVYQGNVFIEQGKRTLSADQAEVVQTENKGQQKSIRKVTALGNVIYTDQQIKLTSSKISALLDKNDIDVDKAQYQFIDRAGRGQADSITMRDGRYSTMENGKLTLCPQGDNSWSIEGSTIKHDKDEDVAEIWNAVFKVGAIPIFYSPYLQFPTSDRRRSGFLIPSTKYSKNNGLEISFPYYANFAPNFDATFTTHYISRRGLQLENEFRYLFDVFGEGTLALDFLPHDKLYKKEKVEVDDHNQRWLFFWSHNMLYDKNWHFNADYTNVSDGQYFNDLSSEYGSRTDGYATQRFNASYNDEKWEAELSMRRFQVFDKNVTGIYKTIPQFDFRYFETNLPYVNFSTHLQAARFESINDNEPKATRLHFSPTLDYSYTNRLGNINAEASMLVTHYRQDIPQSYTIENLDSSTTRVIPKFKIDGRMIFERDIDFLQGYTQTLEPRVQYNYTAYRDQSHIKNYDSALLQPDFARLFTDTVYSGLDRIASANQLTTGITTRAYDENLVERFNFSVGQVYYFKKSSTGDIFSPIDKKQKKGSLAWATEGFWKYNDELSMRAGVQYDTRLNEVALANAVLEYRKNDDYLLQLNYRYANESYINALDLNQYSPYKQNISQLGIVGSWPLTETILAFGSYYYDTKLNQLSDSSAGVQFNSCCWGVTVTYNRKIDGWNSSRRKSTYDDKISINFELRGFGRSQTRSTARSLLNSGLIPYQPAF